MYDIIGHKSKLNEKKTSYIYYNDDQTGEACAIAKVGVLLTNRPFILGLFSAFNLRTSYLIFLEKSLVRLFSLYLDTLASLPPSSTPIVAAMILDADLTR